MSSLTKLSALIAVSCALSFGGTALADVGHARDARAQRRDPPSAQDHGRAAGGESRGPTRERSGRSEQRADRSRERVVHQARAWGR